MSGEVLESIESIDVMDVDETEGEDNEEPSSSYQSTNPYLMYLPYRPAIELDADHTISKIVKYLPKAIIEKDFEVATKYSEALLAYIDMYGFRFSKEQHMAFIMLYFETFTMESCPLTNISTFMQTYVGLLKKGYLLKELRIPWEPLYKTFDRLIVHRKYILSSNINKQLETVIQNAIFSSWPYFEDSVLEEVLETFNPLLCPTSPNASSTFSNFRLFLPYFNRGPKIDEEFSKLTIFLLDMYNTYNNEPTWEKSMSGILGNLSWYRIGAFDWDPHLPTMYARIIFKLDLPVNFKGKSGVQQRAAVSNKLFDSNNIARWIIGTLGNRPEAIRNLKNFIETLETFYNPLNSGSWTVPLTLLLNDMINLFARRIKRERYADASKFWWITVPEERRLTESDIDEFVGMVSHLILDSFLDIHNGGFFLREIATLRPATVIPSILEKYERLGESLTEPLKHLITLRWATLVLFPIISSRLGEDGYDGRRIVIPFVNSLLPTISCNDISKALTSLIAINEVFRYIPIVDSSSQADLCSDEEEKALCLGTANWEDFCLQLFDLILSLVESKSLENTRMADARATKSPVDNEDLALEKVLWPLCDRFAQQSSTPIFKAVKRKVINYGFSKILETDVAGRLYCTICQAFTVARPDIMLPKFLPRLCSTIERTITDEHFDDEETDKKLLFHLSILSSITETLGTELVKYRTDLESVLNLLVNLNGKKQYGFVASFIRRLLNSLVFIYPTECSSVDGNIDDPNYLSIKDWGSVVEDRKKLNIKWHVPSKEELEWAKSIFLKLFTSFMRKYENISDLKSKDDGINKILLRDITLIRAAIDGIQPLLPFWDEVYLKKLRVNYSPCTYDFMLPDVKVTLPGTNGNIKQKAFELYSKIQSYLDSFKNDDTDVYIQIVLGLNHLVFYQVASDHRISIPIKNVSGTIHPKKKNFKFRLIGKAYEFHLKRFQCSNTKTWTESHMDILSKMYELSIHRYAKVRLNAQSKFSHMVDLFGALMNPFISDIFVQKLQEGVSHDEFKGALYTLNACKCSPLFVNTWEGFRKVWIALLRSPFSEKNSIIRCIERLRQSLVNKFIFVPLENEVSQSAVEAAKRLASASDVDIELGNNEEFEKMSQSNKENFQILLTDLLSFQNANIHWRQEFLRYNMLSLLFIENLVYPKNFYEYFLDSLISTNIDIRKAVLHTISNLSALSKRNIPKVPVETSTGLILAPGQTIHSVLQYRSSQSDESVSSGRLQVVDTFGTKHSHLYVHKLSRGYVSLPKVLYVKIAPECYGDLSEQPEGVRPLLQVLLDYFKNEEYVKKLIGVFTEEEKSSVYQYKRTALFTYVSRNLGPDGLDLLLESVEPFTRDKDQWKQRCACDVLFGIIIGMKSWSDSNIELIWSRIQPLLTQALDNETQETRFYWNKNVLNATHTADPNKMRFLIELLMDRFRSSLLTVDITSVDVYKNIRLLNYVLSNMKWRGVEFFHYLFLSLQKFYIDTPILYNKVRKYLGRLMAMAMEWTGDVVKVENKPSYEPFMTNVFNSLDNLVIESGKYLANDKDSEENSVARNLLLRFKAILELIEKLTVECDIGIDGSLYKFIPLCCHFESYDPDSEVKEMSRSVLIGFSESLAPPKHIHLIIDQLNIASESVSWKSRLCVSEFLKSFGLTNSNVFASDEELSERVIQLLLKLLFDKKIEVREASSKLLSGFLHSLIVRNPMDLLRKFETEASAFSLKVRRVSKTVPRGVLGVDDIEKGHSAILGLCAFVDTYPYDVPPFLPNILITLSTHLHDPQPIPATLRNCLSNFRRTHHYNWDVHKLKFTEDQLNVLTDIFVSPCYYA